MKLGSHQKVLEAVEASEAITDPELRRLAFSKMLEENSDARWQWTEQLSKIVQVVSVVVGVVISVYSYRDAVIKDVEARRKEADVKMEEEKNTRRKLAEEAERRATESARTFLDLRQKYYLEVVHTAAILSNPENYPATVVESARTRFRELYVAELSLVEANGVEVAMKALAAEVDPELVSMSNSQAAAYHLAHALRDSLVRSWKMDRTIVDNRPR